MERDDIEKAAKHYQEKDHDIWTGKGIATELQKAFRSGAEWRIKNVWHDMKSEEPQVYGEYENEVYPQIPCLVRGQLSTGYGYGVRYWNTTEKVWDNEECDDFECKKDDIEEWAYLDDLIPNKED